MYAAAGTPSCRSYKCGFCRFDCWSFCVRVCVDCTLIGENTGDRNRIEGMVCLSLLAAAALPIVLLLLLLVVVVCSLLLLVLLLLLK